jgi:hypothetical protein
LWGRVLNAFTSKGVSKFFQRKLIRTIEAIEANEESFTRRITDKRISMLRSLKAANEPQGAAAAVKQASGGSGLDELKGVICTRQSRATCFKSF